MNDTQLDKLKATVNEYVDEEIKILNAQYDFLTNIQKNRGLGSIKTSLTDSYSEILKKSLEDYLSS